MFLKWFELHLKKKYLNFLKFGIILKPLLKKTGIWEHLTYK